MFRLAFVFSLSFCSFLAIAQTTPQATTSDALAVSLAQKSVVALTGAAPVSDVTLNATVISIRGSDNDPGTGTFQAKGTGESRADLNLSSGTRSDVRGVTNGVPSGAWKRNSAASSPYAQHNCLTDSAWFFPALSTLTQTANPRFVFKYVGQEQQNGVNTQHIQVFQRSSDFPTLQQLSTMDFYLYPQSFLPMAIDFTIHPDDNMDLNIPVRINFANYQLVQGVEIPFHIQKMLNGNVTLDASVTSAALNTGLPDSLFTLQ